MFTGRRSPNPHLTVKERSPFRKATFPKPWFHKTQPSEKRKIGECLDEKPGIHFQRFLQIFIKEDVRNFSTIGLVNLVYPLSGIEEVKTALQFTETTYGTRFPL
jgi:hypothetical protein